MQEKAKKLPAKKAVLEILLDSDKAISHSHLLHQLGDIYNRVTIYRSLDKLIEEGQIHRIIDMDGVSKYASCKECDRSDHHNHDHVHFSCTKCSNLTCLETTVPNFTLPANYQADEVNFTVSGICPNCA